MAAFRLFTGSLDTMWRPPCREYCIKLLMVLFDIAFMELTLRLVSAQEQLGDRCFSMQLDLWTSGGMEAFGAMCLTWLDEHFCVQCVLLACSSFPGKHDAAAIAR